MTMFVRLQTVGVHAELHLYAQIMCVSGELTQTVKPAVSPTNDPASSMRRNNCGLWCVSSGDASFARNSVSDVTNGKR
jgi:hypothetical protein